MAKNRSELYSSTFQLFTDRSRGVPDLDRDEIKKMIEEEISSVEREIPIIKEQTRPVAPDNAIGRLTRIEAINSKSINEAALRSMQARLSGLKRALANIDDPDFGLCTECGEEIPVKRIKLVPESTRCVTCANG